MKSDVSQIGAGIAPAERSADTPIRTGESSVVVAKKANAGRRARVPFLFAAATVLALGALFALRHYGVLGQNALPVQDAPSADVHTFGGHRYQFVPGEFTWGEAKAKAETMGGHLATVTSKDENEWIYATFGSKLDPTLRASSIWLGGFAGDSGEPRKWVTGEPFTFTDWSGGRYRRLSVRGEWH